MAERNTSGVRRRLLDTALALFAEQGIASVSIRTINAAAQSANQSAVHYHFGNKWGLLEALLAETLAAWVSNEDEFFATLHEKAQGGPESVRELVTTMLFPIFAISLEQKGRQQIKFVARLIAEGGPEGNQLLVDQAGPVVRKIEAVFAKALPDVDENIVAVRVLMAISSALHMVSEAVIVKYWSLPISDPQDMAEHLIDYITAGIAQGS